MTEHDRDLIDAEVRSAYRELPDDSVPPELDAKILRQSQEAVSRSSAHRWRRWSAPVAIAASLLVAVTILLDFGAREQAMPTAAQMDVPARSAPRPIVTDSIEMKPADVPEQLQRPAELPPPPKMATPAPAPASAPTPVIVDTQVQPRALNIEGLKEMPPLPEEASAEEPARAITAVPHAQDAPRTERRVQSARPNSATEPAIITGAQLDAASSLRNRLTEIYELRAAGQLDEADVLTAALTADYPQLNIEVELKAIARERAREAELGESP